MLGISRPSAAEASPERELRFLPVQDFGTIRSECVDEKLNDPLINLDRRTASSGARKRLTHTQLYYTFLCGYPPSRLFQSP